MSVIAEVAAGGAVAWEDCAMTGTPNNNEAARARKLALVVLIVSVLVLS